MGSVYWDESQEDSTLKNKALAHFEDALAANKEVYQDDPEFAAEVDFQVCACACEGACVLASARVRACVCVHSLHIGRP